MEILNRDIYIDNAVERLKKNANLPDIKIEHEFVRGSALEVCAKGDTVIITYGRRVELFRGLSLAVQYADKGDYKIIQKPNFNSSGAMFDNSRNAVLNMETAKDIIVIMALMGLDMIMLYTEDTYEVPEYKYFGYMRGKFTADQLKELDEYAKGFGIELVPCIQTLAHMNQALRWEAFNDFLDVGDILLVDDEKTYEFIEALIRSCRNSFTTNRIHIGMDEASLVGCGKFREKNGFAKRFDILLNHLTKTVEICKKYGFEPIIWSDMFVNEAYGRNYVTCYEDKVKTLHESIDPSLTLVYWSYYINDINIYDYRVKCHQRLTDKVSYAGGAVKWIGYVPSISRSIARSRLGLTAAYNNGVKDVFVTAWGDNGGEASTFCVLPELQLYAEFNYNPKVTDEEIGERLKVCTGENLEDMLKLEKPQFPGESYDTDCITTNKYLLYSDLLCGLFDLQIKEDYPEYYANVAKELGEINSKNYGYVYKTLELLSIVLSKKCEIALKLRKAYISGDKSKVEKLLELAKETLSDVKAFHRAVYNQWITENRIFGYEVIDIRLGSLETRIEYAINKLGLWFAGDIPFIEELEEERLPYYPNIPENGMLEVNENAWTRIVSAGVV